MENYRLYIAKASLYSRLLIKAKKEELTDVEAELGYWLTRDEQIQKILNKPDSKQSGGE
jgi:hypothetical protein